MTPSCSCLASGLLVGKAVRYGWNISRTKDPLQYVPVRTYLNSYGVSDSSEGIPRPRHVEIVQLLTLVTA